MKIIYCSVLYVLTFLISNAQTSQFRVDKSGIIEKFYDSKIDPNDGGTVNVGFLKDVAGFTGSDLLIVKLNSSHEIIWQKTIPNSGEDIFYKVIVCSNGDYIAAGRMSVSGIRRAITCRFTGSSGDLLWSSASSNTGAGDIYWDVFETSNGNIALAGVTNYPSSFSKSLFMLLTSSGNYINSLISSTPSPNEFRNVSELPNGNLIISGFLNSGSGFYYATVLEVNQTTLSQVSQNRYSITAAIPGGLTNNSIWPTSVSIKNNKVIISFIAFQGLASSATQCIYIYDTTTRAMSGSLYYKSGRSNLASYAFFAISENDFILSQSYLSPSLHVSLSRVTNGNLIYDRRIGSAVTGITSIDSRGNEISCSGIFPYADTAGYNLFSTIDFPVASSPCDIVESNSLILQTSVLTKSSGNYLSLVGTSSPTKPVLTFNATSYSSENVCLPTGGINYTFTGNGVWSLASNWMNSTIPPSILQVDDTITIKPIIGGSCELNVPQTISEGAYLFISPGANFIIDGNLLIQATSTSICNQIWKTKNLNVSTYRNGDAIPQVLDNATWSTLTTGAYCYYNNDSATYASIYGKLYNWYAINDPRGLAPVGWHIPSTGEWATLTSCLGGNLLAGGPLKEAGLAHWASPNTGATNSTGFTGLPSGYRANTGTFSSVPGTIALYWSSSELDLTNAWGSIMSNDQQSLNSVSYVKVGGYSVRCVKD